MTAPASWLSPARIDVRWLWVALTAVFINTSYGTLSYAFSVFVTRDGPGGTFGEGLVSGGFAAAIIVSGLAGLFSGTVADLFGTRRVMAGGAVAGACGLALLGACQQSWQFLLVMAVIIGPAMAATFYEPVYVLMNRWFAHTERPRAYGVLTLLSGVSISIFTPLTRALISAMGWRGAMGVLALILVVIGLLVPLLLTEPMAAREGPAPASPKRFLAEAREGLRRTNAAFWLFTAAYFVAVMSYSGFQFHIVAELEGRGFAAAAVAAAVGIAGLVSLPTRLLLPSLAGRVPSAMLLGLCFGVLAVAAWLASIADAWWQVWLFVVLFGLVFGGISPLRGLALSERFAGGYFGRIIAIQTLFVALAHGLGPVIISSIGTDRSAYELGFRLAAAALVASGAMTWWSLRRA
ncbi:MFS transporter [bacterium]|nr:MFS transporter [bacterium]